MKSVSRKQIEAQIGLMKEKIGLQQRLWQTLKERGERERAFIRFMVDHLLPNRHEADPQAMEQYLYAHKQQYLAQADAAEVVLLELKSQLEIAETMLAEAENPSVISPGGGVILPS